MRLAILVELVAHHLEVSVAAVRSARRFAPLVRARHLVFYIAVRRLGLSVREVAYAMHRDHASVSHGCRKIGWLLRDQPAFRDVVERLTANARCGCVESLSDWVIDL